VHLTVNGNPRNTVTELTVAALVAELRGNGPQRGLAVAVNGEVVPRSAWDGHSLRDGDRVEVLTAAQGG
jgi:sulfur carrier protein